MRTAHREHFLVQVAGSIDVTGIQRFVREVGQGKTFEPGLAGRATCRT